MAALISCREAAEKMMEALEGFPATELLHHLACCGDCLARWKALESVHALLQESYPAVEPPPELKAGVMAAVRREMAARKAFRILVALVLIPFAGITLALILSSAAFRFWTILPAVKVMLEIASDWFWRWAELIALILGIVQLIPGLALYPVAALLLFLATLVNLIKRRTRHEMA
ncbi:MAG: hypothetical protein RMK30_00985 [Anaerolineae bacterium]|nr:hypothetical protein [Anaerolineae bacterium]MDW8101438.1 hypothetical protein [Anaerolineae bacterium]